MTSDQLSIFSCADGSLEKAISAMTDLDLDLAESELNQAAGIDPSLANLNAWQKILALLKNQPTVRSLPDYLAGVWRTVSQDLSSGRLLPGESELADSQIAEIAVLKIGTGETFLDESRTVHWGELLVARKSYHDAQRILIKTLSGNQKDHAGLWAVYANLQRTLGREPESWAALVRALMLDPFAIDLNRNKIPEFQRLYETIRLQYTPDESRALLLFFGWMQGLWKITCPAGSEESLRNDVLRRIDRIDETGSAGRFQKFSLWFYLDLICMSGDYDLEARENMMELEPDLFLMYMKKVSSVPILVE